MVRLGFIENIANPRTVLRNQFVSKVGGRPAWLDPVNTPLGKILQIEDKTLMFLLQVYAPLRKNEDAFHRVLLLFVAPENDQLIKKGGVLALRCQLPRVNQIYSQVAPSSQDVQPLKIQDKTGMNVHNTRDPWSVLDYENQLFMNIEPCNPHIEVQLFPEYEILDEEDIEEQNIVDATQDANIDRLLQEYQQNQSALKQDISQEDMLDAENIVPEDLRHYVEFQTKLSLAPDQVIRYQFAKDSQPLLPKLLPKPPVQIPKCENCGAERFFEFQVMPQLINYLGQDPTNSKSIDWSTIVIYSCSKGCLPFQIESNTNGSYLPEFVFVQPA